jgi:ribosomal protein S27E
MIQGGAGFPVSKEPPMMEPEDDIKKFEEELKKPKISGVKKDRIVTCPGCGKKQTVMQKKLGEEVKCRSCGNMFGITRELSQDAHLVTMAAVDMQVKQMDFMERVGKVPPPPKKKITVSSPQVVKRKKEKSGALKALLVIVLLIIIAGAVLAALHFTNILDLKPYLDKIIGSPGS